ncbi:hypothetical protein D3C74_416580 [compost metagenome]
MPAVEEQACLFVVQVFNMQQQLMQRRLPPLRIVVFHAHFRREQNSHKQRINPDFILMECNFTLVRTCCHMLIALLQGPGQATHQPVYPL